MPEILNDQEVITMLSNGETLECDRKFIYKMVGDSVMQIRQDGEKWEKGCLDFEFNFNLYEEPKSKSVKLRRYTYKTNFGHPTTKQSPWMDCELGHTMNGIEFCEILDVEYKTFKLRKKK